MDFLETTLGVLLTNCVILEGIGQ